MFERHPELRSHVSDYRTFVKKGVKVPDPKEEGRCTYFAFVVVFSREGREECQKWAQKVREAFKIDLE